jgi:FtsP/CotA-like multicopper oxidase with cupredoxin domain
MFLSSRILRLAAGVAIPSLLCASAIGADAAGDASITVPAGHVLKLKLNATGVQIYRCRAAAEDPKNFSWSFVAPEAALADSEGRAVGKHYAGPTWEANDGSKVVGKVAAKAPSPEAGSIPWLLLSATVRQPGPAFDHVAYVQRVSTHGGAAPASGCSAQAADTEARVPYTAEYLFYAAQ